MFIFPSIWTLPPRGGRTARPCLPTALCYVLALKLLGVLCPHINKIRHVPGVNVVCHTVLKFHISFFNLLGHVFVASDYSLPRPLQFIIYESPCNLTVFSALVTLSLSKQ